MRALLADDHSIVRRGLRGLLESAGVTVVAEAADGAEAVRLCGEHLPDVLILDLMLPDRDGLDICRALRRRGIKTPILILSAISATSDKVTGLNAGADDYLAKPFEFEELIARVRALLRRGQATEAAVLRVGDVELDLTKRSVKRAGQVIQLTNKEFALLEYFMRKVDRVLTRTQIGEHVWDLNFDPASNVIDVYVSMLRRKIDKGFENPLIHTIIGTGYMFSLNKP